MSKDLIISLVLFALSLSSCRVGEDDPLISLKSRTNRLKGEWNLVKYTSSESNLIDYVETNDVNDNQTTSSLSQSKLIKFSDGFYEEKNNETGSLVNYTYRWEIVDQDTLIVIDSNSVIPDIERTIEQQYEFILSIEDDNKYKIIKRLIALREYSLDATKINGISNPVAEDSVFTNADQLEIVAEGVWYWRDGEKSKAILEAGEVQGNILELRNDKLVITNETSQEENNNVELNFRNDLSSFETKEDYAKLKSGTERKVANTSTSSMIYWEFEKQD